LFLNRNSENNKKITIDSLFLVFVFFDTHYSSHLVSLETIIEMDIWLVLWNAGGIQHSVSCDCWDHGFTGCDSLHIPHEGDHIRGHGELPSPSHLIFRKKQRPHRVECDCKQHSKVPWDHTMCEFDDETTMAMMALKQEQDDEEKQLVKEAAARLVDEAQIVNE
jgi:hypothetical protein